MKRRTFAEVEEAARKHQRQEDIAEVCRVLKHHLGMPDVADKLWETMQSTEPRRERRSA